MTCTDLGGQIHRSIHRRGEGSWRPPRRTQTGQRGEVREKRRQDVRRTRSSFGTSQAAKFVCPGCAALALPKQTDLNSLSSRPGLAAILRPRAHSLTRSLHPPSPAVSCSRRERMDLRAIDNPYWR